MPGGARRSGIGERSAIESAQAGAATDLTQAAMWSAANLTAAAFLTKYIALAAHRRVDKAMRPIGPRQGSTVNGALEVGDELGIRHSLKLGLLINVLNVVVMVVVVSSGNMSALVVHPLDGP